ncbi:helix-turn-helix transcriptional regulator [Solihabitans fulvus]|uniref:Helix-turn-helix transcriptional regulator n=1 Tax=Solihabitans fulvus TaxID=1892852 RepID=A0A5B2XDV5_9PSEU|nr:DUF5937 family protein [Solihabitans fulvus]KAA2261928.1 helix-turn-helix transcriptional regulator [Solihabitans fulvus]
MIELRFSSADLARVRFALSPMEEMANSLVAIAHPANSSAHRPWLNSVRRQLSGLDIRPLLALVRNPHLSPAFLRPTADGVETRFADGLGQFRASTADDVRDGLERISAGAPQPPELRALYDDPERELGRLAGLLAAYWNSAVEPVWSRVRALLDADLGYRARTLTTGGLATMFAGLHREVEFTDDRLLVHKPHHQFARDLPGNGLVLVPSVFTWPTSRVVYDNSSGVPGLTYVPRGIAELWGGSASTTGTPLVELVGRSRAAILAQLDLPLSTTQLAANLGISPPSVSHHLSILRRSQLVSSRRTGRTVLYERTPRAIQLLRAERGR